MLKCFRFGDGLIEWIRMQYEELKCRIIKNNFLSRFSHIKKGVRQGDPPSFTIFILCIEYLAIMLCQKTQYCGLKTGTALVKVSFFFNNTVICLNDSATEFKHVFTILEAFGSKSGCKVNISKSCVFYLGTRKKKL